MTYVEDIALSPAQDEALQCLLRGIPLADVLTLKGRTGDGKSTILRMAHALLGGALLGMRQFIDSLADHSPAALEESLVQMIDTAAARHDLVFVDDLHLLNQVAESYRYPRANLIDAALTAVLEDARRQNRRLIFASGGRVPGPVHDRAWCAEIGEFTPEDYAAICRALLGQISEGLDYARIHRVVPALSALQLRNACRWHGCGTALTTVSFLEYLRSRYLKSNVSLEEVEHVDWNRLKGVDHVLRELEIKIALPFEHDALSAELRLKPKRGVLLAGPPGTGKTTIGRALAHRLKGKFFLIDGTVVAGSSDFYCKLDAVFAAARKNAPSVVFIDDADVIFEGEDHGFYRYLLTLLDGLESASAERVCLMMTAMHPGALPPALLRSGRVELWLEVGLPDVVAREAILRERLAGLPDPLGSASARALATASRNLTGADLKNVVEDGKLLFAHDRLHNNPLRPANDYFLEAIATVRKHRREYARSKPPKLAEPLKVGFGT